MRYNAIFAMLVLCGCSKFESAELLPKTWTQPSYETCNVNVINNPPRNLFVTVGRSDLPERYDAVMSSRPIIIKTDKSSIDVSAPLINIPYQMSAQPYDWSANGLQMTFSLNYEDANWGMREDFYNNFFIQAPHYHVDVYLYDLASAVSTNLTASNAVSFFNAGGVFTSTNTILFSAIINSQSRPFTMNLDGSNKQSLVSQAGFVYGATISPDGTKYAYHNASQEYQIYIGDVLTGVESKVNTGNAFNFMLAWSPDSQHIAFTSGQTGEKNDIWVAQRDAQNPTLVGRRSGFVGVVPFMDGYDFHGGGSDIVSWTSDSAAVVYAAGVGSNVELFKGTLSGTEQRLTYSPPGAWNNNPNVSSDGKYIVYTASKERGKRNVYFYDLNAKVETQITDMSRGCTSRYPKWSPM